MMMLEWPGRCRHCGRTIENWSDAGYFDRQWIHKTCFAETRDASPHPGYEPAELRSPVERGKGLEWPMMAFVLMFHFGLAAAVAGWILLTQGDHPEQAGWIVLGIGIVTPLIGVGGAALNVISRRRIEIIRQQLDLEGGWRPGR